MGYVTLLFNVYIHDVGEGHDGWRYEGKVRRSGGGPMGRGRELVPLAAPLWH